MRVHSILWIGTGKENLALNVEYKAEENGTKDGTPHSRTQKNAQTKAQQENEYG